MCIFRSVWSVDSLSSVHTDCDNGNDNGNGRMDYIGLYGSVHMETCGKGNINPLGPIQSILSVAVAVVSVNEPLSIGSKIQFCCTFSLCGTRFSLQLNYCFCVDNYDSFLLSEWNSNSISKMGTEPTLNNSASSIQKNCNSAVATVQPIAGVGIPLRSHLGDFCLRKPITCIHKFSSRFVLAD